MKTQKATSYLLAFALLMMSSTTFAQVQATADATSDGISGTSVLMEDEGADLAPSPPPEKHVVGDVTYVSGGIGKGEVAEMKRLAKNYPLEIVCVQKEDGVEGYIADVKLQISDTKGNLVLDVATDGPFLLADLPKGKYTITAEYNNTIKTNHVTIGGKKHQRLVFAWVF